MRHVPKHFNRKELLRPTNIDRLSLAGSMRQRYNLHSVKYKLIIGCFSTNTYLVKFIWEVFLVWALLRGEGLDGSRFKHAVCGIKKWCSLESNVLWLFYNEVCYQNWVIAPSPLFVITVSTAVYRVSEKYYNISIIFGMDWHKGYK